MMQATSGGAREEVLARIGNALGQTRAEVSVVRGYRAAGRGDANRRDAGDADADGGQDLAGQLADRLSDYRAVVHRSSVVNIGQAIADVLAARRVRTVIVPPGFPSELLSRAAIEPISDNELTTEAMDACDGTISTCAVAIAETGTIVLDAGPGQGRRALSLLTDYLLVIIWPEQIVAIVPDAVALLQPERPLTWISGPSATSDIELKRVEGVHGPRVLDVLLITAESGDARSEVG